MKLMINFRWLENGNLWRIVQAETIHTWHWSAQSHQGLRLSICATVHTHFHHLTVTLCNKIMLTYCSYNVVNKAISENNTYRSICVIYGFLRYDSCQQLTVQRAWAAAQYSVQNWKAPTQRTQTSTKATWTTLSKSCMIRKIVPSVR